MEELHHQNAQTLDRTRTENGHNDMYGDANTMGDGASDDPLIRRLGQAGQAGAIYHKYGDRQGQATGNDEVDDGGAKRKKTMRNRIINSTSKHQIPEHQPQHHDILPEHQPQHHDILPRTSTSTPRHPPRTSTSTPRHPPRTSTSTPRHPPRTSTSTPPRRPPRTSTSTPRHPPRTSTSTPPRTTPRHQPQQHHDTLQEHQPQHHDIHSRSVPRDQSTITPEYAQTYGIYGDVDLEDDSAVIIHVQGPSHPQNGLPVKLLPGNQSNKGYNQVPITSNVHHQIMLPIAPSNITLGNQQASYGVVQQMVPQPHHNDVILNANNPYTLHSNIQQLNQTHPSVSPLHGQYVNETNSSRSAPISFHGSLMNIHEPQMDGRLSAMSEKIAHHLMNISPVTRHQSLLNLSQSPVRNQQGYLQYNTLQQSTAQPNVQQNYAQSLQNVTSVPILAPVYSNPQKPPEVFPSSNLRHGMSEPNLSSPPYENATSQYNDVQHNHGNLRAMSDYKPSKSRSRLSKHQARPAPSQHALSRSEPDQRHIPQTVNQSTPLSNGMSNSERVLHYSAEDLRQTKPNTHNVRSSDISRTHHVTPSDPQLDYYKKLYSSTPQLNQATTASGLRSTDHTLDPSVHTWMHEIPLPYSSHPHESHLYAKIHPASRPLSPLSLLEIEVANQTMDAEDAIIDDNYEKEQLRRQAVIDSIIGQSQSGIRSHDPRLSPHPRLLPQATPTSHRHRPDRGRRSEKTQRESIDSLRSPARTSDIQMMRNLQTSPNISLPTSERYPSSHQRTLSSPQLTNLYQSRQLPLSHTVDSLGSQQGNMIFENGWREQHLRDLGLTPLSPQEATSSTVNRQSIHSPSVILNRTDRDLGLSSTLPQSSAELQSVAQTLYNKPIQSQNDRGLIQSSDYLEIGQSSPLPTNTSLGFDRLTVTSPRHLSHDPDVNWRQQHLRDLGLSPIMQQPVSSRVVNGVTPSTQMKSSLPSTNWRHQHLRDLGIYPSANDSNLSQHTPVEGHTVSLSTGIDQKRQRSMEVRTAPRIHHSATSHQHGLISGEPLNRNAESNWRQDQLRSPSMNGSNSEHATLKEATVGLSCDDTQTHQHPVEVEISPSIRHTVANQNTAQVSEIPPNRHLETNSNWRLDHLRHLGISPSMHQYTIPIQHASADIAPVTSRLRGVIGSGRSLNDMDEGHHLVEETRKKR